jgi:hypothetical protein
MPLEYQNRVLLYQTPFIFLGDRMAGTTWAHLPYMLNELIALGITNVTICGRGHDDVKSLTGSIHELVSEPGRATYPLPPIIKNRLVFIDRLEYRHAIFYAFEDLFDEFGIKASPSLDSFSSPTGFSKSNEELTMALIRLSQYTHEFITAKCTRSQCSPDVDSILQIIDFLLSKATGTRGLTTLSILKGIFSGYKPVDHDALHCRVNPSDSMLTLFDDLIHDANYRALSVELHRFGIDRDIASIKHHAGQLVRQVIDSRLGRNVFSYGSKLVSVHTGSPMPDGDFAQSLLRDAYFPPIVDLAPATEAAGRRLAKMHPDSKFLGPGTPFTDKTDPQNTP